MTYHPCTHQLCTLSVVIPVYRDELGISRCLKALAKQSYPSCLIQVVVVNNDPQLPLRIEEQYPFEVVTIPCSRPGSYAARNAGVRASRGCILAFTDADCQPFESWLASGVERLRSLEVPVIFGGDVHVDAPSPRSGVGLYQHLMGFRQRENIENRGFAVTANLFCSRSAFMRVGEFDETLLSGGDQEWGLRARSLGVSTHFASDAVVSTPPRTSLASAARQARRVAAGRLALRNRGVAPPGDAKLHHKGNRLALLSSAFTHAEIGPLERIKVLAAAIIIKLITFIEIARLGLGGQAERR